MLPDVDLVLRGVPPSVRHHGVTQTVLCVVAFAVVGGIPAARFLARFIEGWWLTSEGHSIPRIEVRAFVAGGMTPGGSSHVFADVLSSPDVAPPVKPLWPVYRDPVTFDVTYDKSPVWIVGLVSVALLLHLGGVYADVEPPRDVADRFGR